MVGKYIQELTGADIFLIEPEIAYPTDYNECVDQAKKEINEGFKPKIKGGVADINSYDVIIIGTPNWWSTIAPPVLSFVDKYDFTGKTILPFVTHVGGREARCFTDMGKEMPESDFKKGFAVSGNSAKSSKQDVEKWLREAGIIK